MKEHLEFLRQQTCRDDHVGIRNKLTWSDEWDIVTSEYMCTSSIALYIEWDFLVWINVA
jgi:hypothetical protein